MNDKYLEVIRKAQAGEVDMDEECSHLGLIKNVSPSAQGCEECLKIGDIWVHLRLCLICGKVGCCDNSKNKHATRHFHESGHELVASFEPDEDWMWCYSDETLIWPV